MPLKKKPFSTKMKKKLLKEKREKKAHKKPLGASSSDEEEDSLKQKSEVFINSGDENYSAENEESSATEIHQLSRDKKPILDQCEFNSDNIYRLNAQPGDSNKDANRYALQFFKESDEQMRRKKMEASKEYKRLTEDNLEIKDEIYEAALKEAIPFPKRPEWSKNFSKEKLLSNEQIYFKNYLRFLEDKYGSLSNLSYFEMNLETWRQLWRTLEMSDIVLLITDIRYSVFHFPITLYDYVKKELKKELILVLNKCDLIPAELVIAWVEYWKKKFPDISVLPFAAFSGMRIKDKGKIKGKRFGKFYMASESVRHLYKVCEKVVDNRIDISDWEKKIEFDLQKNEKEVQRETEHAKKKHQQKQDEQNEWLEDDITDKWTKKRLAAANQVKSKKLNRKTKQRLKDLKLKQKVTNQVDQKVKTEFESDTEKNSNLIAQIEEQCYDYHEFKPLDKGVITIGCIGHPNSGKSSVLNAIIGKIVVSVSRTPGHTKHFQTIFLTNNVRLCDCPGLVFPSSIPKQLQILMGCYPIAQLREPYSAVQYIAERIDLVKILKIKKSEDSYEDQEGWSAMEICEQFATKRGYFAAKSARPDVYRAANQILRMALDGRTICLTFYPPDYLKTRDTIWKKHPELNAIKYLQCQTSKLPEKEREFKTNIDYSKNSNKIANLKLTDGDQNTVSEESTSDETSFDELYTESDLDSEIDI